MIVGEPGLPLDQRNVGFLRHLGAQPRVIGHKLRFRPAARLVGRHVAGGAEPAENGVRGSRGRAVVTFGGRLNRLWLRPAPAGADVPGDERRRTGGSYRSSARVLALRSQTFESPQLHQPRPRPHPLSGADDFSGLFGELSQTGVEFRSDRGVIWALRAGTSPQSLQAIFRFRGRRPGVG